MSWLCGKGMWLVLIGSLAFNAGMGTTFGVRAYQHRHGGPPEFRHERRHRAFLDGLDLRPEQLAKIEAEADALHAQMRELHGALADESAMLADLLVAVEPDREAITAQLDRLAEMHKEKQRQVVDHFLRVSELLDDQQRGAFEDAIRDTFLRFGAGRPGFGKQHPPHGKSGHRGGRRWRGHDD